jgi:hypothetical protein
MSTRFTLLAGILLASLSATSLSAQQPVMGAPRDTGSAKAAAPAATPKGASSDSALVELGRAITALAVTLQTAVAETAKNPEIRRAAVQTAGSAVSVAQRALAENTGQLERLLLEASRKLAAAEAAEKAKAATAPAPH